MALPAHRAVKGGQLLGRYFIDRYGPRSAPAETETKPDSKKRERPDDIDEDSEDENDTNDDDVEIPPIIGEEQEDRKTKTGKKKKNQDDLSRAFMHLLKGSYPGPTINGLLHWQGLTPSGNTSLTLAYHNHRKKTILSKKQIALIIHEIKFII